mgnify:CR=1 FL=1
MLWNPEKDDHHKKIVRLLAKQYDNVSETAIDKIGKLTVVETQLCAWIFESHCWILDETGGGATCEWCGEKVDDYIAPLDSKVWIRPSKVCPNTMECIKAWDKIREKTRLLVTNKRGG